MKLVLLLLLAVIVISGCISYSGDSENSSPEITLDLEEIDIRIQGEACWKTEEVLEVNYLGKYLVAEEEITLYFQGEPVNKKYIDILEEEEGLERILLKKVAKKGIFGWKLKQEYEIYGTWTHYLDIKTEKLVTKSGIFLEDELKNTEFGKDDWRWMFSALIDCYDFSSCQPKRNWNCVEKLLNDSSFTHKLELIEADYKKILHKPVGCWTGEDCRERESCISRAESMWLYGTCKEIKKRKGIRNPVEGRGRTEELIYSAGELTANSIPLIELYVDNRDITECDVLENKTSEERIYCGIARFVGVYDVVGTFLTVLTLGQSAVPIKLIDSILSKIKILAKQHAKQSRKR